MATPAARLSRSVTGKEQSRSHSRLRPARLPSVVQPRGSEDRDVQPELSPSAAPYGLGDLGPAI